MSNFFNLTDKEQKLVIEQTNAKLGGVYPQIIEKDLWVTTFLQLVFALPFADKLVFKGGTSLGKIHNLIERFSEDIDLAVDRKLFDLPDDLTKKQIKKLRKEGSIFVKDTFCMSLQKEVEKYNLQEFCQIEPEPDGVGDNTYPEPRKIFIRYHSLFDTLPYVKAEIVLEVSVRSLIEPTTKSKVNSLIAENLPTIETTLVDSMITTTVPEKTFIEKAFLLHEIFTANKQVDADRRSRHLYDLWKMMGEDFAKKAIHDDTLWDSIHQHRKSFTSVSGVDYSQDIRSSICLVPPKQVIDDWQGDFEKMKNEMIYDKELTFDELVSKIKELEEMIRLR